MARENFDDLRKRLVATGSELKSLNDPNMNKFEEGTLDLIELLMFSLIKDQDNFFGNIAIQLHRRIDYSLPAAAAVTFRGTYFELLINPLIILKWNLTEIKAVIVHECYHIMNQHLIRFHKYFNKYPHIILNYGLDVTINQYIKGLPDGCITIDNLVRMGVLKPIEEKREAEYYINLLMNAYKNSPQFKQHIDSRIKQESGGQGQQGKCPDCNGTGQNQGSQSGQSQGSQGSQSGQNQGQCPSCGGSGQQGNNGLENEIKDSKSHDAWQDSDVTQDMENMGDVVRSMANEALGKARGKIPGEIQALIKKLNEKPILPWQDILRQYVGTIPVPYKKTVTRRDRRQPYRLDLRGRLSDHVAEIVVAIDTSGSMSDKDIAYCMGEVFEIVKNTKSKVTIVECDTRIGRTYEVTKPEDVKLKVTGRGGTSFSPVFEWIREKKLKRSILVYFTDGYGERSLTVQPVHFKTLWVLTGQGQHLSLSEPHGEVRELRLDKKYRAMGK